MKPAMTPQQAELTERSAGALAVYRGLAVGRASPFFLLRYELASILSSNLPGLCGYGLRALLYPGLFLSCGRKPAFGKGMLIRNPRSICLGDKVLLDDYTVLDARGVEAKINLGNHVSVGRFSTLAAKGGEISLADGVNIGSYCRIATQSRVQIGESVLVAAYCYIGPGNHQSGDEATPLISRQMEIKGGVKIGAHAWLGAHCTILDGVTVGEKAVIGAHSLVLDDVPDGAVVAGVPARRIK